MAAPSRIYATGPEIDPSVENNEWINAIKATKQCAHEVAYVRQDTVFYDDERNMYLDDIRVSEIREIDGKRYGLLDEDNLPLFHMNGKIAAVDPVSFLIKIKKLCTESANRRRQDRGRRDLLEEIIMEFCALDRVIQDDGMRSNIRRIVRDAAPLLAQEKRIICDWANERV